MKIIFGIIGIAVFLLYFYFVVAIFAGKFDSDYNQLLFGILTVMVWSFILDIYKTFWKKD